jgi:hypothetical protein
MKREHGCAGLMADGLFCASVGDNPMLCDDCTKKLVAAVEMTPAFERESDSVVLIDGKRYRACSDNEAPPKGWKAN